MYTPIEPASITTPTRNKPKKAKYLWIFLIFWIILVGGGAYATYSYSNYLRESMLEQLDAKLQIETNTMKADYEAQLALFSEEIIKLQDQVQSFNELLTFTKDNASDKTDNSNKLYTQLSEVKKQLAQLQQKMDLLK